jgi:putative phosphoribosyl transferase
MIGRRRHLPYADRRAAGAALAAELNTYADRADLAVLGLPRGGVPVAAVIAQRLAAPLDVLVVRKLGLPRHPEVAMGAVAGAAGSPHVVRNPEVLRRARITDEDFQRVLATELAELRRREELYRGSRSALPLAGRVVLLVDDGLATGATMRVAVHVVQRQEPARIVLVAPVGPPDVCAALAGEADELVCPWQPSDFSAVGAAYRVFDQTSNDEVRQLLSG